MVEGGRYAPEIEELLRDILVVIRKATRDLLEQYNLTLPQFQALLALRGRSLTMGELCEHLMISSSTATELVDRLERAKLLERARDPGDRRVIRLHACESGRSVVARVLGERTRHLARRLASFSAEEAKTLLSLLEKLRGSLGQSVAFGEETANAHSRAGRQPDGRRR